MKKLFSFVLVLLLVVGLCGCNAENAHTLSYVEGKMIELPFNDETLDCVAVFTKYTNGSSETTMPADEVGVKAFQNGVELSPWVFTGEKTEGYIQCDTSVQSGKTADVIWIFERDDDSKISIEFSDGQKFTIEKM